LDVAGGSSRCFEVGGAASVFFSLFGVLDFLGVEADRLCGLTALLGLLVRLGLMLVLLLGGLEPLVSSLSLPLPIVRDLPSGLKHLFGLADLDLDIELDLRASVTSLGLWSLTGQNAPMTRPRIAPHEVMVTDGLYDGFSTTDYNL
jgi:hypothetical protein